MASVHLGRLRGSAGFARTVAIKRLLPELATDPELVTRFVDEARIASRVQHANVVPTLDVVDAPEVLLVLEYIHGESLWRLLRLANERGERCPPSVASAIMIGVLRGLHVAHQAKGANGVPLQLVHRDVSPQNVLVGADGVPRVLDFGIAKAVGREQSTINKGTSKELKGKLAYMAPEQIAGEPLDRRCDLFAAGVMLWETLASERLFKGEDAMRTMEAIFHRDPPALANGIADVSPRVDEVLATALAKDTAQRFATADEMARAIEIALPPSSDREVADWVAKIGAEALAARTAVLAEFEGSTEGAEEEDRDDPNDPTTLKRSAVFPPALPGAIPPNMRDSTRTLPLANACTNASTDAPEPIRTPLAMITPAIDPLTRSGMTDTRIGPIDLDAPRRPHRLVPPLPARTPIQMPMPALETRFSAAKIAALVLVPPAAAAIALLFFHPVATAAAFSANGQAPVAAVIADPPPPPPPLPQVPAPQAAATPPAPVAAKAIEPAASSAPPPSRGAKVPRGPSPRMPRRR